MKTFLLFWLCVSTTCVVVEPIWLWVKTLFSWQWFARLSYYSVLLNHPLHNYVFSPTSSCQVYYCAAHPTRMVYEFIWTWYQADVLRPQCMLCERLSDYTNTSLTMSLLASLLWTKLFSVYVCGADHKQYLIHYISQRLIRIIFKMTAHTNTTT